jgi:hypothetical protein
MLKNFAKNILSDFQRISQKKSYNNGFEQQIRQTTFYNQNGTIIPDTRTTSLQKEISENPTVQNAINKQLGILLNAELDLFESSPKTDKTTTNKDYLQILDFFKNPKYQPFCSNWQDILSYVYQSYYINGIAGLVLTFSNQNENISTLSYLQYGNFKYLQNADAITTNSNANNLAFNVSLGNNLGSSMQYIFHIDTNGESKTYGNYVNTSKDETKILIVFKNYDFYRKCFISPFVKIQYPIMTQNSVNRSTFSFYQNACRPSGILNTTSVNGEKLTPEQEKQHERMVDKIKKDFIGSVNTGQLIMPTPGSAMTFTPITVPADCTSDKSYNEMFSEMIYAFFHGGSKSAFEGISEYSNNAFQKQKTMYDGAFQTVNSVVIFK